VPDSTPNPQPTLTSGTHYDLQDDSRVSTSAATNWFGTFAPCIRRCRQDFDSSLAFYVGYSWRKCNARERHFYCGKFRGHCGNEELLRLIVAENW